MKTERLDSEKIKNFCEYILKVFVFMPKSKRYEIGSGDRGNENLIFYHIKDFYIIQDYEQKLSLKFSNSSIEIEVENDKNLSDINIEEIIKKMKIRVDKKSKISRENQIKILENEILNDKDLLKKKEQEFKLVKDSLTPIP